MINEEYNLQCKKNKLTKEQKEFVENNYKDAVNCGDRIIKLARQNPQASFYEILEMMIEE